MEVTNTIEIELKEFKKITQSLYDAILFSIFNYSRGPEDWRNNFFLRITDEFIEVLSAIEILVEKGFRNQCRRELRFALETAIKAAYINQSNSTASFEDKLIIFNKLLKDSSISIINDLKFPLISDNSMIDEFSIEVKRMYGHLSNFIHITPEQLTEKISLAKDNKPFDKLNQKEFDLIKNDVGKTFSYIVVLLFNSMPQYVVGDFMEPGISDWYFYKSRFVCKIDEDFDYKHERKSRLEELKQKRENSIKF